MEQMNDAIGNAPIFFNSICQCDSRDATPNGVGYVQDAALLPKKSEFDDG